MPEITSYASGTPSWVDLSTTHEGDSTEVILTHQNFADQNMRDEHQKGWGGCLTQLASLVENLS